MKPPSPVRLSPSRAADFKACPQLYKFRAVDRRTEPEDPYSALGSLVHAVLERLLAEPAESRTSDRALQFLQEAWDQISGVPEFDLTLFGDGSEWLARANTLLGNYFDLEDPTSIDPRELEWRVEHLAGRMSLRGIIDRVEIDSDGEWILTDYKTGQSPSERASFGSFFALRFYALLCWRAFGKLPKQLRLVHLRKPEVITLVPTAQMLEGLERQMVALGSAITRAFAENDFRPRPGPLCNWCPHKRVCPANLGQTGS